MIRIWGRVSKRAVYSFCLVTGSFWAVLVMLHAIDRLSSGGSNANPVSTRAAGAPNSKESEEASLPIQLRHWVPPPPIEPGTTFSTSPYNAANKRKLGKAAGDSGSPVKLISWQAVRTLRVLATSSDMFLGCPVSACEVSPNAKIMQKAHAVVFDDGRMAKQTPPQLSDRRVMIYYNMRTPNEMYFKAKGDLFNQYWKSAFNWVWSFRRDADIFEPFSYLKKRDVPANSVRYYEAITKKKSKLAVWIDPKVNRRKDSLDDMDKDFHKGHSQAGVEDYLAELRKKMPYDTKPILELKEELEVTQTRRGLSGLVLDRHYFVLAFEWVACSDYVSDLFFYAFHPRVPVIPVVRGAVNYTLHFPKDSFINADDFSSAADLAVHLRKLAADKKQYSSMLWRKSMYTREKALPHAWCQLCEMLHRFPTDEKLRQRYDDFNEWLNVGSNCQVSEQPDEEDEEDEEVGARKEEQPF